MTEATDITAEAEELLAYVKARMSSPTPSNVASLVLAAALSTLSLQRDAVEQMRTMRDTIDVWTENAIGMADDEAKH
jgi:hypothetical protein